MKKLIKVLLFIPFVLFGILLAAVEAAVMLLKAVITAKGTLKYFDRYCDLYHTDKISRWWTHRYRIIHREEAIMMGLKFHSNIYGDLINMYDCRSLWQDDSGRRYRVHELEKNMPVKPKIICYCGSFKKAYDEFKIAEHQSVFFGEIGLFPAFMQGAPAQDLDKGVADELHKRRIDICDEVRILNVGGYIGESTLNEIKYAESIGKPIKYLVKI